MAEIEVKNISHSYGSEAALRDVSFIVPDGSCTVILGPSGCGKTTLLRCIAGLEKPSGGSIFFDGRDVTALAPAQRRIAMIFQSAALFEFTTVKDNIGYGLRKLGYSNEESRRMVYESAEKLHIAHLLDRYPHALSGGERQRASIARALVRNPSILLLDEPFSSLDARLREELQQEVRRLQKETGMTMILVTHDQSEAALMADRLIVLHEGKIEADGNPKDLYDHPPNLFTADFLGPSRINRIEKGTKLFERLREHFGFGEGIICAAARPTAFHAASGMELDGTVIAVRQGYEENEAEVLIDDCRLLIQTQIPLSAGDRIALKIKNEDLYLFDQTGMTVK